jgi:hypothetical protein
LFCSLLTVFILTVIAGLVPAIHGSALQVVDFAVTLVAPWITATSAVMTSLVELKETSTSPAMTIPPNMNRE